MTERRRSFEAEIVEGRGGGALVGIPFSVKEAYGVAGRVEVRATFDGHAYRGSLAPMGGGAHVLGIRKAIREAIGKDVGDTVVVTLERDTDERVVDVPPELASALAADAEASRRFERLSFTHRREFAEWIAEGKKQDTRDRRAARAVDMIRAGSTR